MTNKTEDRFYFGKPDVMATPMGEHGAIGKLVSRAIQEGAAAYRAGKPAVLNARDPKYKGMSAKELEIYGNFWMRGWDGERIKDASSKPIGRGIDLPGMRFSRPGQPERFGLEDACWEGYEPVGTKQKDGRTVPNCVPKDKNEQPEEFAARADGTISGNKIIMDDGRTYEIVKRQEATGRLASDLGVKEFLDIRGAQGASYMVQLYKDGNYKFLKASGKPVAMTGRIRFSRPGQPDKFDASSLDRGNFAEASKSPMLGKLLSAKVMPDGGWRAVQVGSDTLVISFEDADLARDFGRRASTKGYSATSPVATTGRYWNVEVKNGK